MTHNRLKPQTLGVCKSLLPRPTTAYFSFVKELRGGFGVKGRRMTGQMNGFACLCYTPTPISGVLDGFEMF